jgi:hypothetical protein
MKKKTNSGEETLQAIRRNSAYPKGRTISLLFSIALVFLIIVLTFLVSKEFPVNHKIITLFIGISTGGLAGLCLLQFFHAHYDQSDSLIQVAKFQERSLRRRNDALDLVEKIREEVEDEQKEQSTKDIKEIPDQEDIQTEESKEETA